MSEAFQLPARLDLPAAIQLVSDLRGLTGDVEIDASQVNHLGALCLQALIASSEKARENGHKFVITGTSEKVEEQLEYMGTSPQKLMEGTI